MEPSNYCFYNPHVDDFLAEPPHFRVLKRRALKKYGHLFQESLDKFGSVKVFVDGTTSAFIPGHIYQFVPKPVRWLVSELEFFIWKKINNIEKKVERIKNPDPNLILFAFSFKGATHNFSKRKSMLEKFKKSVFHLSHYYVNTGLKGKNLSTLQNLVLAGDTDIKENPYFQNFFGWYQSEVLLVPFCAADRFQFKKPFKERDSKLVAMGTFHNLKEESPIEHYTDYMNFFKTTSYHPVRKEIYENKEKLTNVDCRISPYRPPGQKRGFIPWIISKFSISQKSYFRIDIVELYNSYKYAVIGEEAVGFPALGAFESMACGCVYFGQEEYYKGLGFEANVHYCKYDGSIEDLLKRKEELDQNQDLAEKISQNALKVVEKFRRKRLIDRFHQDMLNL